jgi:hypothetical protein
VCDFARDSVFSAEVNPIKQGSVASHMTETPLELGRQEIELPEDEC